MAIRLGYLTLFMNKNTYTSQANAARCTVYFNFKLRHVSTAKSS